MTGTIWTPKTPPWGRPRERPAWPKSVTAHPISLRKCMDGMLVVLGNTFGLSVVSITGSHHCVDFSFSTEVLVLNLRALVGFSERPLLATSQLTTRNPKPWNEFKKWSPILSRTVYNLIGRNASHHDVSLINLNVLVLNNHTSVSRWDNFVLSEISKIIFRRPFSNRKSRWKPAESKWYRSFTTWLSFSRAPGPRA
jgi:hypothetical protein